jgi:tetratricopeptide (TPR) repeat protein
MYRFIRASGHRAGRYDQKYFRLARFGTRCFCRRFVCRIIIQRLYFLFRLFFFANNYFQAANNCFEKKDYACAVENYTATINWSPKYWLSTETDAYNSRGNAYLKMGDVERALKDYSEAVKRNPHDANAAENLKLANNFRQKKSYQY